MTVDNTNPKYSLLNYPEVHPGKRTVIVTGLGRSGTSFAASVLAYLGVFLGDEATKRTNEDHRLGSLLEERRDFEASKVIAEYNERHQVWGLKRPSMFIHAARTEKLFRNPRYIITHRDLFAIALRNEIAISRDILQSLEKSVDAVSNLYKFMGGTKAPTLHLSFELINADRRKAAEIIRDFAFPNKAGTPFDDAGFEEFMDAKHKDYFG